MANIERPKVIYNELTGMFVLWMHKENGIHYGEVLYSRSLPLLSCCVAFGVTFPSHLPSPVAVAR